MSDQLRIPEQVRLIIDVLANILEIFANMLLAFMPFSNNKLGHLRIRPFASDHRYVYFGDLRSPETVDSRIAKIESARSSLSEALSAIDELKETAENNKRDLELLRYQIHRAETYKQSVSGELEALKGVAALDSEAVRKALKMPTRVSIWTERVISFVLGISASVVASWVYEHLIKPHTG